MRRRAYINFPSGTQLVPLTACKTAIVRTPSPVDAFTYEEIKQANGKSRVHVVNDIGILFNQQRLMQLSPMMLDKWLGMARHASPDDGLSDEQILSVIKSRYIQSTTDIYNWTRALGDQIDGILAEAKANKEAEEAAKAAETQTQQAAPVAAAQ